MRDYKISLVTRYLNRAEFLDRTLPTWVALDFDEIIIVDWSSTDGLKKIVDKYQNGKIIIAHVPGQKYFHRAKPINVGVRLASHEFIAHVDSDVLLENNFLDIIDLNNKNVLYTKNDGEDGSLTGTCIFTKEMFKKVNGYNEAYEVHSAEDINFYKRIKRHYPSKNFIMGSASHIYHSDELRTINERKIKVTFKKLLLNNMSYVPMEKFDINLIKNNSVEEITI